MITRLYTNNFRCLMAFEVAFDSFGVLCGPNGAGKSSVFDAIKLIKDLATGDCYLGGDGENDVKQLEFTKWLQSSIQEFEIGISADGQDFEYLIHLEQKADFEKPRVIKEVARAGNKVLFERNLDGVSFDTASSGKVAFPLDWRQAALASIQPRGNLKEIAVLQEAISRLLILRPDPRSMEAESKGESRHPDFYLRDLTSWYRSLSQEQDWTDALRDSLRDVWPDFKSFRLVDVGLNAKVLQLRFGDAKDGESGAYYFNQLSDGEKALIGLYMIRASLSTGIVQTVLIDEPDNYVGLPEIQPWLLSLRELLDEEHQVIAISHHPEILNSTGEDAGRYLWRDNHSSPTRIESLTFPDGMTPSEAISRGWVRA